MKFIQPATPLFGCDINVIHRIHDSQKTVNTPSLTSGIFVYIRSFLYYVPYVTLSVMTFPAILTATASVWSAVTALVIAIFLAYKGKSLFIVSLAACTAVFLTELFL